MGQVILRSKVEEAFSDLESAYASKNIDALTAFLDKDFEAASWFGSSTENYLLSVSNPRIHFIIDAVLTDKNGITVRFHWFKKGTVSGVETKSQGASLFVFKKYPEALRIVSIRGENPFF